MTQPDPFDEKRHEALMTQQPIRFAPDVTPPAVHKAEGRVVRCATPHAVLVTDDWRLVNCASCRASARPAGSH
ncbi:hypothetical protein [Amycolatopsis sp. NPDC006125]|uniref:hypothetical protein n=1 Tax=Amycolatopsis sp. NPDC006125 TaxID=3156730 RepID=UPI0033BD92A8